MITERFELGGTLVFISTKFETPSYNDACFEFTEHSPDGWYSDRETEVSIDAERAKELIAALNKHFGF